MLEVMHPLCVTLDRASQVMLQKFCRMSQLMLGGYTKLT